MLIALANLVRPSTSLHVCYTLADISGLLKNVGQIIHFDFIRSRNNLQISRFSIRSQSCRWGLQPDHRTFQERVSGCVGVDG